MNPLKRLRIPSRLLVVVPFCVVLLLSLASTAWALSAKPLGRGGTIFYACLNTGAPLGSPNLWAPSIGYDYNCSSLKGSWVQANFPVSQGPQGPRGPQGPQGPSGLSQGYAHVNGVNLFLAPGMQSVARTNNQVGSGLYIINATVPISVQAGDTVYCRIGTASNPNAGQARAQSGVIPSDSITTTIALTDTLTLSSSDYIQVGCYDNLGLNTSQVLSGASITVLKVNALS